MKRKKNLIKASVLGGLLLASSAFAQSYNFVGQSENGKTQRQFNGSCSAAPGEFQCIQLHTPTNNCKMSLASGADWNQAQWDSQPYAITLTAFSVLGATCPIPNGTTGTFWPLGTIVGSGKIQGVWTPSNNRTFAIMDGIVLTPQ